MIELDAPDPNPVLFQIRTIQFWEGHDAYFDGSNSLQNPYASKTIETMSRDELEFYHSWLMGWSVAFTWKISQQIIQLNNQRN